MVSRNGLSPAVAADEEPIASTANANKNTQGWVEVRGIFDSEAGRQDSRQRRGGAGWGLLNPCFFLGKHLHQTKTGNDEPQRPRGRGNLARTAPPPGRLRCSA